MNLGVKKDGIHRPVAIVTHAIADTDKIVLESDTIIDTVVVCLDCGQAMPANLKKRCPNGEAIV